MSDHLKVVESLHPGRTPRIASLHERLMAVIDEYCEAHESPVTKAEVVGTLEFVKADIMDVYE